MLGGCQSAFPNIEGAAEDPLHISFRVEACFGEHTNALSAKLRVLQRKFNVPDFCGIHPHSRVHTGVGRWPDGRQNILSIGRDLDAYVKQPYKVHQEYVDDLFDLTLEFPDLMSRSNEKGKEKGRTVRQILQSGSSYEHFAFLSNGCHIRASLSSAEQAALATGTAANEAIHNQLRVVYKPVVQQHVEAASDKFEAFSMTNLLAHGSAAYHPTLKQRSQLDLMTVIEGRLANTFFTPFSDKAICEVTSHKLMSAPVHHLDKAAAARRVTEKEQKKPRWALEIANKREKNPRAFCKHINKKRTVFNQLKPTPLRRKPSASFKRPSAPTRRSPIDRAVSLRRGSLKRPSASRTRLADSDALKRPSASQRRSAQVSSSAQRAGSMKRPSLAQKNSLQVSACLPVCRKRSASAVA